MTTQFRNKKIPIWCANPPKDTCIFYTQCIEPVFQCGIKGYPIAYGNKYCNVFLNIHNQFSPKGQEWAAYVRQCLQHKLIDPLYNNTSTNCSLLTKIAINSHADCYLKGPISICELSLADKWTLMKNVKYDLNSLETVQDIVVGCAKYEVNKLYNSIMNIHTTTHIHFDKLEFVNNILTEYKIPLYSDQSNLQLVKYQSSPILDSLDIVSTSIL